MVVGAGPAGATAAIYLARRGYSVEVFERRPEPKGDQVRVSAYSLSLLQLGLLTMRLNQNAYWRFSWDCVNFNSLNKSSHCKQRSILCR